jgi:hypothetical protein
VDSGHRRSGFGHLPQDLSRVKSLAAAFLIAAIAL